MGPESKNGVKVAEDFTMVQVNRYHLMGGPLSSPRAFCSGKDHFLIKKIEDPRKRGGVCKL